MYTVCAITKRNIALYSPMISTINNSRKPSHPTAVVVPTLVLLVCPLNVGPAVSLATRR